MRATPQGLASVRLPRDHAAGIVRPVFGILQQHRRRAKGGRNAQDAGVAGEDAARSNGPGEFLFLVVDCVIIRQNIVLSLGDDENKNPEKASGLSTMLSLCSA